VTPWAGTDPRARTLFAVAVSCALAVAPAAKALLVLPGILVLLLSAGLDGGRLRKLGAAVGILWILSFVANAFLVPGTRVGPHALGWARPTGAGLAAGFAHGGRLAGLACLSAWVTATTGALDLAGSVEWSVRGWPRLRRAAHRALLPGVLGLRMIPLFMAEAGRILEVDRLRAGPGGGPRRLRRLAGLGPVWMVTVVERADALALALTLRGYRSDVDRGFARPYRWRWGDWGLLVLGGAAVAYLGWL
jgi:energy-coupling factor transporter transmembrane protein EcfT